MCREALPSLGRPHWGRPVLVSVQLPLQRHVCDQPVPLLCLSHGGVCSCASRLATISDGQRRARDKRGASTELASRQEKRKQHDFI